MQPVDVVVVAYNSRGQLRAAVEPLASVPEVSVVVVDNDSPDHSAEVVADLPVTVLQNETNVGFAKACNMGWRSGTAPYVLFLNPDAQIDAQSIERMTEALADASVGLVAPRTVDTSGALVHSQRRFVGVASVWAH